MSRDGDPRAIGDGQADAVAAVSERADAAGVAGAARAEPALRVEVRRGEPTAEELAAVIAVVTEAYQREAETEIADPPRRPSAWQVSARLLREPLRRELSWGTFGG